MKRGNSKVILVILIFFGLSLIFTWPLIVHFNQGIAYTRMPDQGWEVRTMQQGDHLQLYYHFWLAKDALRKEYPFFIDPYEFSVEGMKIFTVRRIPLSILFVIFSFLGGAFAYNSVVIFSIIFSGLAMFLLAKVYLKKDMPSFTAALIYAASPFALSQLLGGHTNGFLWGLAPLAVFSIERLFASGKIRFGFIYLFCLLSCALIEYHLLYYLTLFTLILVPVRTVTSLANWKKANLNLRERLLKSWLPVFISLAIVFVFVMYLKNTEISASIAQKGRSLSEVRIYSPQVKDLFSRGNTDSEKNVYLGIIALSLAFLGLAFNLFRPGRDITVYEEKINLLFFSGGLIITSVLALGTNLSDIFPLYNFCYKYIPYFNYPRVPGRIVVISFMCLALLSGYGVTGIINLSGRIKKTVFRKTVLIITGVFMSIALFLDYNANCKVGISLFDDSNNIYKTVRENSGDKKLLELPLWPGDTAWSSIYLYYATLTRVKIINGYYPLVPQEYVDKIFYPLISLNLGCIAEIEYKLLKELGVKYITFHTNAFPQKVSHYSASYSINRLMEMPYVKFITQDDSIWLFELRDKPVVEEEGHRRRWPAGIIERADQFRRHVGRLVDDPESESGRALFASPESDSYGYLLFGRQQVLPRGEYKVIFHIKTDDNTINEPVVILDINGGNGHLSTYELKEIKGTDFKKAGVYQDFVMYFEQKWPLFWEFRICYLDKAPIWADYIYILPAEEEDPLFHYEAEELFYRGVVEKDQNASGERAILFSPGFTAEKEVLFGPRRRFPAGSYQASFRLKTDTSIKKPIACLEVTTNWGKEKLAEKIIKGSNFKETEVYQDFSFPFELQTDRILEFRVIYYNEGKLWTDKIELRPNKAPFRTEESSVVN